MKWVILFVGLLSLSGCFTPTRIAEKETVVNAASTQTNFSRPAGALGAQVIFRATDPAGSFDSPSGSTQNSPGAGLQIQRIFNADGTLLADGGTNSSDWPKWINRVELGISGANNTHATSSDCARFAAAATDGVAACDFDLDGTMDSPCGAPEGFFRVSEIDCASGTTEDGNGGPNDGVYVRVVFNRNASYLASFENIKVVLEYSASTINSAAQDPRVCFLNGVFNVTSPGCSDMSWGVYLKESQSQIPQPFLNLIPPVATGVQTSSDRSGTAVFSREFILPLATNPNLSILQISRRKGLKASAPNFASICASNSAHCVGVVLHSMTFYRL